MRLNLKLIVIASILAILGSFVYAFNVAAQTLDHDRISVTIETSAAQIVETSFSGQPEGVKFYGQRWKPSEQVMSVAARPTERLSLSAKFDVNGLIENAPKSVDPDNGRLINNTFVNGYTGESHRLEIGGAYRVAHAIEAAAGFLRYALAEDIQYYFPDTNGRGGGWLSDYQEENRWQGFYLGAAGHFKFNRLGVVPAVRYYPSLARHFKSHQTAGAEEFHNDMDQSHLKTRGLSVSGEFHYQLIKHLLVTAGYSYERFTSTDEESVAGRQHLEVRGISVGLRVGF